MQIEQRTVLLQKSLAKLGEIAKLRAVGQPDAGVDGRPVAAAKILAVLAVAKRRSR